MTQFHAGPTYTRTQQAALDAAFSTWMRFETVAENAMWRDEALVRASAAAYAAYKALKADFDAANAKPAPVVVLSDMLAALEMQHIHALETAELADYEATVEAVSIYNQ
jgi:hypothetical protein